MPPKPKRGQAGRFISAAEAAAQAGDSGTEPVPGMGTPEVSARLGDEHTEGIAGLHDRPGGVVEPDDAGEPGNVLNGFDTRAPA